MTTLTYDSTSRYVEAGGTKLHFHDAGEGVPVVFLHGSGPGASGWSNFHQNLPALSRQFRCLVLDMPGWGESDKPEITGGIPPMLAGAVRGFLDELGIERAHVVGNSLGGAIAFRLAIDEPERVGRVVAMGPGGVGIPVISPEPSEGVKYLAGFYGPPGPSRDKMQAFVEIMVHDASAATDELVDERYASATTPEAIDWGQRFGHAMVHGGGRAGWDMWRELDRVTQPTLLVWGRDDRVMPLDMALFPLHHLDDVRLHVFGRCGHWAQAEHTAEFDRLVAGFLAP